METTNARLVWLVPIHVAFGVGFCGWSAIEGRIPFVLPHLLVVPALAFVLAQTSLLAFWTGLWPISWYKRLPGMFAGIVYLETLCFWGSQGELILLPTLTLIPTAGVLMFVRDSYVSLTYVGNAPPRLSSKAWQFSIRGLMMLTFLIAVTITMFKLFHRFVSLPPRLDVIGFWSMGMIALTFGSIWAALRLDRPHKSCVIVLASSSVIGAIMPIAMEKPWDTLVYMDAISVLQSVICLASLSIVRLCGFRLVHRYQNLVSNQ